VRKEAPEAMGGTEATKTGVRRVLLATLALNVLVSAA
jgi:hypothetical protein